MTAPPQKMRFLVPTILWLLGSSPSWPLPAAGRFRRRETAASAVHAHDYDEYMIVIQGRYTLIINGERIPVKAGQEYFIPSGVPHSGEVLAGIRTIHAFGGHRADRV